MIFQIDAFIHESFLGNPAGACLLQDEPPEPWMQSIAAEMKFSETAFVLQAGEIFLIRYFTPIKEVPLCGHATLASAHLLWEEGRVPESGTITFQAKEDMLKASKEEDWICLDLPAYPVKETAPPSGLADVIGVDPLSVWKVDQGGYLLELDSETAVRGLTPDFTALRNLMLGKIIITAPSYSDNFDFVSRFFWPEAGIDEDPVTGAAHCSLGPFWAERLDKTDLLGYQASSRGGVVRVRIKDERVDILGHAVTKFRFEMPI